MIEFFEPGNLQLHFLFPFFIVVLMFLVFITFLLFFKCLIELLKFINSLDEVRSGMCEVFDDVKEGLVAMRVDWDVVEIKELEVVAG